VNDFDILLFFYFCDVVFLYFLSVFNLGFDFVPNNLKENERAEAQ